MAEGSLTQTLWGDIETLFDAILAHPFLEGLVEGDLPEETFGHYLVQDALYLQVFARALSSLGGRAPTTEDTEFFATRAARVVSVERTLHRELLGALGMRTDDLRRAELSPTGLAYTSYISARVNGGFFADGLASVLPCFWIYREVAKRLAEQGSRSPLYQSWIDSYESPEFQAGVDSVLELMDRVGRTLSGSELVIVRTTFAGASRYEWMFWDSAWRRETWPVGIARAASAH